MNSGSSARFARKRLMTVSFVKPEPAGPAITARKTSAIPPWPSSTRSLYFPNVACVVAILTDTNANMKRRGTAESEGATRACARNLTRDAC